MAAVDILHKQRDELAARVKLIPGGPRDYGLLASKAQKLYESILETVPDDQLMTLMRNIPHMAYTVGTKKFSRGDRDSEYGMWISFKALAPISEVLHEHCIRDTGVKDYWWDGDAPQELEAEAPDLTDYYTRAQVDALLPIYLSESAYAALVAAGTTEAGRVYYPVPDDQWEVS